MVLLSNLGLSTDANSSKCHSSCNKRGNVCQLLSDEFEAEEFLVRWGLRIDGQSGDDGWGRRHGGGGL